MASRNHPTQDISNWIWHVWLNIGFSFVAPLYREKIGNEKEQSSPGARLPFDL